MKWILFTGTWKITSPQVEFDVRQAVRGVLSRGDGIVTGGATGVDYFAMDEALKLDSTCRNLCVIIPAYLQSYINDYRTNWLKYPITEKDIENLDIILQKIKTVNPNSLQEMPNDIITQDHYNLRHDEEVKISDEIYAFQVNDSTGTQDTINKAISAGLPIVVHKKYEV